MSHITSPIVRIFAQDVAVFSDAGSQTGLVLDIANELTVAGNTTTPVNAWGVVANAGAGDLLLKNGCDVGNTWGIGPVILEAGTMSNTTVHGVVRCATGVTVPNPGATITGNNGVPFQNQNITLGRTDIIVTFPPPPANIVHNQPTTLTLPPGAYGNVSILQGTLSLSTPANPTPPPNNLGVYTFESLLLESGTTFLGNNATGILRINVKGKLTIRAAMTNATNPLNLRFAVFGTEDTILESGTTSSFFRGTVVAMNSKLLIQGPRTFRGAFLGRTVTIGGGATIQFQAFSLWEPATII
jgi:hypothetical protein